MNKLVFIIAILLCGISATAQLFNVSGTVVDGKSAQTLPGALATVTSADGGSPKGETTDLDGNFSINVKPGKYTFKVSYMGYKTYEKVIDLQADMKLGKIKLKAEDLQLDEVKATGVLKRQEQKGDTTVFNAEAFKVNPDATTEDLIKKMPGMQVSGNSVTSGGETVKRVLVDGKEYFGDDPMAALRNLQADMVSKIEVYDRQSDQSQFTGFSDGNEERTINILTKMGITKGRFGRVYGGYGTNDRYEFGGNMNFFRGDHRISVLAMLNNINQQNFSFADVTGAMSNGGGMGGMFSMGRSGKNRTGAVGLNYTYEKEDTLKIEFSYTYRNNKNTNHSESYQEYFTENENDSVRTSNSYNDSDGKNYENSTTLRLTWTIDKNNSIIFTPRFNWQNYKSQSANENMTRFDANPFLYHWQESDSKTSGVSGSGNILWRHRFEADHRTLSLNIGGSINNNTSDNTSYNVNDYAGDKERSLWTSQLTDNESKSYRLNGSLMYTEPLGENLALQINYSPSISHSSGDRNVKADTTSIEGYSSYSASERDLSYTFSPILSNVKESDYMQQRGGVGLNFFKGRDINASVSLDFQRATLDGDQTYPNQFETHKSFSSVLPSANLRYRKGRGFNLNFHYRTNTNAPSINQLQKVVDVSNSMRYSGGNEDLEPAYSHNMRLFLAANNVETSRGIFAHFNVSTTKNNIATSTIIARNDTIIDLGIMLPRGVQYDKPVNIDGQWSVGGNLTLSTPVSWLGSNVNLNFNANLRHSPSLYNGQKVYSDNSSFGGGITIGSSFSENVDFTISYNGTENIIKSTKAAANNYNYYSHNINADLNCLFFTRLVLSNSLSHVYTDGLSRSGAGAKDNNYLNWNAAVAVKFFADRRGELRLKVNDILDNTQSVNRSISTAYVQTSTTDVLRRYALLTFTYKFKATGPQKQSEFGPFPGGGRFMGPPPGMGGGRGGRRGPEGF